ncbi:MAG: protein translocase subunit SecD, partial [Candidatus Omnitrophica bacterium]|nr:protein translocase subunit SecD [Candidatus Omnitrophota bacterium]
FKYKVLLILALVGFAIYRAYPPQEKINLGLDLQGGMYLILKAEVEQLPEGARKDATDRVREIISNRIDEFGVAEPSIQRQGNDRLIVQLPGITNRERAINLIKKTALLEFKLVEHDDEIINKVLEGEEVPGCTIYELGDGINKEKLVIQNEAVLTGDKLVDAGVQFDSSGFGQPIVALEFNKEGGRTFAEVTSKAARDFRSDGIPRRLAIILDGKLHSAPQMKERIPDGRAVITGSFGINEARDTAIVLRAGALPCPISIEEERTVGPSLGQDSINKSITALTYGFVAVIIFVAVYYLFPGLVALLALFLNVVLIAGALAAFHASLTLPGVAGIILTIGMAVDANVLIFERMREEFKTGKTVRSTISSGYQRVFGAIFDSNFTTLITALLLFIFGTGPVKGFAVTLSIGILSSMFTALFVTRVVFDYLTRDKRTISLKMLSVIKGELKIDFISKRYIAYVLSIVFIVTGMVVFVKRGQENYGIDFTGGTLEQIKFVDKANLSDMRKAFADAGSPDMQISRIGEPEDNEVIVRSQGDTTELVEKVLIEKYGQGNFEILKIDKVGPTVGNELRGKAIKAVLFALIGLCVYIWFRFEFKFGIAAILALFHDVLATLACIAFTGREINLPVVAAIMTIVGYSLNDTIVIFDRIRENLRIQKKTKFSEVVNSSINQTMSRTILTSLTTLFVVMAIFFFGGSAINDFAFSLMVGIVFGTYSTVFVASPVLVDWHKK